MEGTYVDLPEEMNTTEEFIEQVVKELNEDDSDLVQWWEENDMPQGLQLVEMHMHPTTREFLEKVCQEKGIEMDTKRLVQAELLLDSMIS
jgi:hypothetical protein